MISVRIVDATYRQLEALHWSLITQVFLKDFITTKFTYAPELVMDIEVTENNKFTREALEGVFARLRVCLSERETAKESISCVGKFKVYYY